MGVLKLLPMVIYKVHSNLPTPFVMSISTMMNVEINKLILLIKDITPGDLTVTIFVYSYRFFRA